MAPVSRESFLEGAEGQRLQALKLISVFLSPCCLGLGHFRRASGKTSWAPWLLPQQPPPSWAQA